MKNKIVLCNFCIVDEINYKILNTYKVLVDLCIKVRSQIKFQHDTLLVKRVLESLFILHESCFQFRFKLCPPDFYAGILIGDGQTRVRRSVSA